MRSLCLLLLALTTGCGTSGNLLFLSTNTIGLRITTSDPASNAAPNIIIGHASVKGVINPVRDETATGTKLREQAYSVIGITAAGASASENARVESNEWFATGRAADRLAENPNTPSALAGSRSLTPEVLEAATDLEIARTFAAVDAAYDHILNYAVTIDSDDQEILDGLDATNSLVGDLQFQTFDPTAQRAPFAPTANTDWSRVRHARQQLQDSIVNAENYSTNGPDDAAKANAADTAQALRTVRAELDRKILATDAAQATWRRFLQILGDEGEDN
ncbi:MAG: hypothetical protein AAF196_00965 [Planctomycetota bacterium]